MKIAVLSGKGGTGKTLISVNLAASAKESIYIDCDVEEPNGHLFFKPVNIEKEYVTVKVPFVDEELCTGCMKCVDFCGFNALAYAGGKLKIFEDICHSCGGCMLVCPEKALAEKDLVIGQVQKGDSGNVTVYSGFLKPGEPSGTPIIGRLLSEGKRENDCLTFIDCPPGSACIVMDSIKDADYCVLVAEPTLFGAHNLEMVWELVELFNKPYGVVLNKCQDGDNPSEAFCKEKEIKILGRIDYDQELGELNSNGEIVARVSEKYKAVFSTLLENVIKEAKHGTAINLKR